MEIRLCTQLYYLENGTTIPVDVDEAVRKLQEGVA